MKERGSKACTRQAACWQQLHQAQQALRAGKGGKGRVVTWWQRGQRRRP